jgi:hypothetical protein
VTASPDGTTVAVFTVDLSPPSNRTVVVYYSTADGTATAGNDYVAIAPTPLVFLPGQTEKSITVPIYAAPQPGAAKTFTVKLSYSANAGTSFGEATGTINTVATSTPS